MSKRAFSIHEFCQLYGVSKTLVYKEIKSGRLQTMKVGRRRLITDEQVKAWEGSD